MRVAVRLRVIVAVVANQADVHADQQSKNQRLNEADEEFQELERNGQTPARHRRHRVQEIFAAINVAEQPE